MSTVPPIPPIPPVQPQQPGPADQPNPGIPAARVPGQQSQSAGAAQAGAAQVGAPAAGWYPDPQGTPGLQRYWDGAQWTANTAPGGQAPTGNRRKKGLIIGIGAGVAVLLIVLILLWALVWSKSSPSDIVERYTAARLNLSTTDCNSYGQLVSAEYRDQFVENCESSKSSDDSPSSAVEITNAHITSETINGDSATVVYEYTASSSYSGSSNEYDIKETYSLIQEDGAWRINDVDTDY
ncbi:DUF2510 domain-containing protein [Pseudoclavibacter soli]|uniref:DUF2510 domain-containing protein n=1 Tax=Pseudoclavibacter soli TaxID=452623 RepID=UPI000686D775|nr:DUF2510 domain-containing protein [Pseudoclavibacter soli]